MVGMLAQCVTPRADSRCAATSRSQRGMSTEHAPAWMAACITPTMPVMWNIGTTARFTLSGTRPFQALTAIALCMIAACDSMQPLGWPVVPLV